MADTNWLVIHAEREALADDLADLTAQQWQTPSLCNDWTVHQVLAHQVATAKMTPPARRAGKHHGNPEASYQVSKENPANPAGVAHGRAEPPGQLVAGSRWMAGRACRRAEAGTRTARRRRPDAAGRGPRHIRLR
jgi:uncharacterized protein (TIGR03083 family)